MKYCTKLLVLLLIVFISCKPETKNDFNKTKSKDQELSKNQISKNGDDDFKSAPIDFLEEKYKNNGYSLPDYSPTFPTYSFSNEKLGIFSVNYIGKSEVIQNYWNVSNSKGFFSQFQDINQALGNSKLINDKVSQILDNKINEYYIVASFLPKESIAYFDDGSGDFELKKDAYTYFYIYENNKWVFIKKLLTNKIDKGGVSLYNDLLLNDKVEFSTPIPEKFLGQFEVSTKGELTNDGTGQTTYYFTITTNKIVLKAEAFRGDFLCEGNYKGVEKDNILEVYYNEKDDRCKQSKPNYLIKKDGDEYFIKGVGGEATFNEWIKLDKK
ncbi:hypothetical protein [Flavobacterium pectinovorum]|uniref:Lipoprotein n=1 Tax=Flavobacterium pectinovorum TaxID=29533 RepID=A0A502F0K5_9FLAO|nr:hypothetical protein [Flavobacterium pectinovorum]TPG41961.1 hypothetical protein EAH81_06465 [Flavobacterium pectinovorum]